MQIIQIRVAKMAQFTHFTRNILGYELGERYDYLLISQLQWPWRWHITPVAITYRATVRTLNWNDNCWMRWHYSQRTWMMVVTWWWHYRRWTGMTMVGGGDTGVTCDGYWHDVWPPGPLYSLRSKNWLLILCFTSASRRIQLQFSNIGCVITTGEVLINQEWSLRPL